MGKSASIVFLVCSFLVSAVAVFPQQVQPTETVHFPSRDSLQITADIYRSTNAEAPWLILCHQARWSRGEYRSTAGWFVSLGYHCIAVDLRSGGEVNNVQNETYQRAVKEKKATGYLDALQDIEAAIGYVRSRFSPSRLILVGSSYSASLALLLAGTESPPIDGVIAFSPGEYFTRFGKPPDFITRCIPKIPIPAFIACAAEERAACEAFRKAANPEQKIQFFIPEIDGAHGSRALWPEFPQYRAYRAAVKEFLTRWFPVKATRK